MDTHETDARAKKVLTDLQREQQFRLQNPSLLVDDLKELGMYGELSDDNNHLNMPFEDVHAILSPLRWQPQPCRSCRVVTRTSE